MKEQTGPTMKVTMAYCRVSTEEQAEEGYSIDGQADKLRQYANLRDQGEVVVISDPGISGKDLNRPGVQQLLAAIEAGHVAHVLVWRLDRLSRNLGDLVMLADLFGKHDVALHSVSENLDLSSAAGRMFYNILATFAQFYREQLAENVKLGNERAVKEGKYINRPKLGYDLVNGELIPNDDAVLVREVFRLKALGESYRSIEAQTGVLYSTIGSIVRSRVYRGERPRLGEWIEGTHEPLVSEEEWAVANGTLARGRHVSTDPLSGHIVCGLCGKRMAIAQNGQGGRAYKCRNRGVGCAMPARSNLGLARAAVHGLRLFGHDESLHAAIRRRLAGAVRTPGATSGGGRRRRSGAIALEQLSKRRAKLLELFYAGKITQDGFYEGERALLSKIEAAGSQARAEAREERSAAEMLDQFEALREELAELDFAALWADATERQQRVLIDELLERIVVHATHLEVTIAGSPLAVEIRFEEVGLRQSESVRVGGRTRTRTPAAKHEASLNVRLGPVTVQLP
jgi:DNA invertase Pin-like site-specific DNA recombinase